jgi:NAD(P)-dependent dehydrogenase (short-subunit alcohol dehydrogenase family)
VLAQHLLERAGQDVFGVAMAGCLHQAEAETGQRGIGFGVGHGDAARQRHRPNLARHRELERQHLSRPRRGEANHLVAAEIVEGARQAVALEVGGARECRFLRQTQPANDHVAVGDLARADHAIEAFAHEIHEAVALADVQGEGRMALSEADFDSLVAVHLKGVFFLTQKMLPLIADGCRIINLSSGLGRFAFPGTAAYAMMKGGIEVFTRSLAKELGPRGITANTVAPGAIATDFNGGALRDNPDCDAWWPK